MCTDDSWVLLMLPLEAVLSVAELCSLLVAWCSLPIELSLKLLCCTRLCRSLAGPEPIKYCLQSFVWHEVAAIPTAFAPRPCCFGVAVGAMSALVAVLTSVPSVKGYSCTMSLLRPWEQVWLLAVTVFFCQLSELLFSKSMMWSVLSLLDPQEVG